jgi:hypothetical protein
MSTVYFLSFPFVFTSQFFTLSQTCLQPSARRASYPFSNMPAALNQKDELLFLKHACSPPPEGRATLSQTCLQPSARRASYPFSNIPAALRQKDELPFLKHSCSPLPEGRATLSQTFLQPSARRTSYPFSNIPAALRQKDDLACVTTLYNFSSFDLT